MAKQTFIRSALTFVFLQLASDLKGKKIGLVKEGFDVCEKDVISIVKSATNKFTEAGAIVEEISIPMHADGKSTNILHKKKETHRLELLNSQEDHK